MRKGDKKGELLVGNIIFIILNLMFLTILFLFITQQGSGLTLLEQSYAKQIALVFDSAKPGMTVFLDFEEGFNKIEENIGVNYQLEKVIKINENIVTVKLDNSSKRKGYSYAFFNNISLARLDKDIREDIGRKGIYFVF